MVVPASELDAKVNARLDELKARVRINGFRPGKVPVAHLKRIYGRATMAEVIEATVRDANNQIVGERGFKLAADPKVTMPEEQDAIEQLIAGQERPRLHRGGRDRAADRARRFQEHQARASWPATSPTPRSTRRWRASPSRTSHSPPRPEGGKAESGDRVVISYAGTINGEPFEGGTGEDAAVLIGSNTFIPGFEEQLIGIAAGENRTLKVTFPEHY